MERIFGGVRCMRGADTKERYIWKEGI
jgi:hypothetical protein